MAAVTRRTDIPQWTDEFVNPSTTPAKRVELLSAAPNAVINTGFFDNDAARAFTKIRSALIYDRIVGQSTAEVQSYIDALTALEKQDNQLRSSSIRLHESLYGKGTIIMAPQLSSYILGDLQELHKRLQPKAS
jgi:hypothetical protein